MNAPKAEVTPMTEGVTRPEIEAAPQRSRRIAYLREQKGNALLQAFRQDRRNERFFSWITASSGAPLPDDVAIDLVFQRYRNADPTPKAICLQRMLDWAIEGSLPAEDLGKAMQTLAAFVRYKGRLAPEQRDINRHHTLGSVWRAVAPLVEANVPASGKEEERRIREAALANSEILVSHTEDSFHGWTIACPHTMEAARWWGRGTRWCTASDSDNDNCFSDYDEDGPLIVFVSPKGEKFQFHAPTQKTMNFMDAADEPAPRSRVLADLIPALKEHIPGLYVALFPHRAFHDGLVEAVMNYSLPLDRLPLRVRYQGICEAAVEQRGRDLEFVPFENIDRDLCETAVKKDGRALEFVPWALRDREICQIALETQGSALEFVPPNLRDPEMCLMAVRQYGFALKYVPEAHRDRTMCLAAVGDYGGALEFVPLDLRDSAICEAAVRNNGFALAYVPDELRTEAMCMAAISEDGRALKDVPETLRSRTLCEVAVKDWGWPIIHVPKALLDEEMCLLAVQANGFVLQRVPNDLLCMKLYVAAVFENESALRFVPEGLHDAVTRQAKELRNAEAEAPGPTL